MRTIAQSLTPCQLSGHPYLTCDAVSREAGLTWVSAVNAARVPSRLSSKPRDGQVRQTGAKESIQTKGRRRGEFLKRRTRRQGTLTRPSPLPSRVGLWQGAVVTTLMAGPDRLPEAQPRASGRAGRRLALEAQGSRARTCGYVARVDGSRRRSSTGRFATEGRHGAVAEALAVGRALHAL